MSVVGVTDIFMEKSNFNWLHKESEVQAFQKSKTTHLQKGQPRWDSVNRTVGLKGQWLLVSMEKLYTNNILKSVLRGHSRHAWDGSRDKGGVSTYEERT